MRKGEFLCLLGIMPWSPDFSTKIELIKPARPSPVYEPISKNRILGDNCVLYILGF